MDNVAIKSEDLIVSRFFKHYVTSHSLKSILSNY